MNWKDLILLFKYTPICHLIQYLFSTSLPNPVSCVIGIHTDYSGEGREIVVVDLGLLGLVTTLVTTLEATLLSILEATLLAILALVAFLVITLVVTLVAILVATLVTTLLLVTFGGLFTFLLFTFRLGFRLFLLFTFFLDFRFLEFLLGFELFSGLSFSVFLFNETSLETYNEIEANILVNYKGWAGWAFLLIR